MWQAIVKERLIAKRFFSQVIAGFAGTLAGGDFSVAANSAAIALDYNMEPTLTGAAVTAYLAQQLPALTTFLATPQGMAVAASLGIAALSIDQIKENLTLLGKLHQVYVMVLRGEIGTDSEGRLYNKKGGDQGGQIFTQSSSRAAAGGMPPEFEPNDEDPEKNRLKKKLKEVESAQQKAVKTETLPDGRIRYYNAERLARNPGPTRGTSRVVEHNPRTGNVRSWEESYNHKGEVTRVHPETINGQDIKSTHYPLTGKEMAALLK